MRAKPMKRSLGVLSLFAAGGCCHPGASAEVPVSLRPQEASQWCWAASGQMVMETLHHGQNQCTQVNHQLNRSDCGCSQCSVAAPAATSVACDQSGWPEFEDYGFRSHHTRDEALSWDQLRKQVSDEPSCDNKPFAFTWRWPGGGGHMMVVNGYRVIDGERYVSVIDPWAPCHGDESLFTYDYYVALSGHHTHWDDYYDISYRSGR
jgi:hypothetical protein